MSTHFRRNAFIASLVIAVLAVPTRAVANAEQVVGGIDAVLFVCTPIDAKSVKPGQEMLQRAVEQHKLDLPSIRKSAAYRSTYNAEVNRLLAMPPRDRLSACQSAW